MMPRDASRALAVGAALERAKLHSYLTSASAAKAAIEALAFAGFEVVPGREPGDAEQAMDHAIRAATGQVGWSARIALTALRERGFEVVPAGELEERGLLREVDRQAHGIDDLQARNGELVAKLRRLEGELERLRAALRDIADERDDGLHPDFVFFGIAESRKQAMVEIARAALSVSQESSDEA